MHLKGFKCYHCDNTNTNTNRNTNIDSAKTCLYIAVDLNLPSKPNLQCDEIRSSIKIKHLLLICLITFHKLIFKSCPNYQIFVIFSRKKCKTW